MIVGTITALNNYKKELQFRALQAKQDDSLTTVWRAGAPAQVSINDICVGDVVQLDTGSKIPAGTNCVQYPWYQYLEFEASQMV
jgi:Ca2+-transporting ATPase